MKQKSITKYFIMAIIGGVLAWFNFFAPLHEIWHWWFGLFAGRNPDLYWTGVAMDPGVPHTIIDLSGFFGEVLLEAGLSLYFLNKAKFGWSGLFAGMIPSAAIFAVKSTDFYEMPLWGLKTAWIIYVSIVGTVVVLVTAITFNNLQSEKQNTSKIPGKNSIIR